MRKQIDRARLGEMSCEQRIELGGGVLEMKPKCHMRSLEDLSVVYTPGVAEPCRRIAKDPELAYQYTIKANTVAVISDGTAVLGLGDIGPRAALPVMEGKSVLFKTFAQVDAVPLVVDTTDVDDLEKLVRWIAPTFGGINLEDISAPRCVELLQRLQDLDIPVFHDDQDGTAIVVTAALKTAMRLVDKKWGELKVIINGAGAAGYAIAKMLTHVKEPPKEIYLLDSKGIINRQRKLAFHKAIALDLPHVKEGEGDLASAMQNADVFIGVSKAKLVTKQMVRSMRPDPIIFALANPVPEILPDEAYEAGAAIVGTGRSDYPNQINNVLAFPGIFRGALDARASRITEKMMVAAASELSKLVANPRKDKIIPKTLDRCVSKRVAQAVKEAWGKRGGSN